MRNKNRTDIYALFLVLVTMIVVALTTGYMECRSMAHKMAVLFTFGPVTGCMVEVGDHWYPIEAIRVTYEVEDDR